MRMQSEGTSKSKGNQRPLPDQAYVSLTEAATWVVEGDCRDDDYLIEQDRGAKAQQWVSETERDTAYDRFYALLQNECSLGRIILSAIEYRDGEAVSGKRKNIPAKFFIDAIVHWRGSGPRLKGELGPDLIGSRIINGTKRLVEREEIIKGEDARSTYTGVRIKRDDVSVLRRLFEI